MNSGSPILYSTTFVSLVGFYNRHEKIKKTLEIAINMPSIIFFEKFF
jgi:hypothetical protein